MKYQCHMRSTMQPAPKRLLHTALQRNAHCSRNHCTDHIKRGTFNESGSGVEPGFYSPCQHERKGTRGKNDVNIEEMVADGGFSFHFEVKSNSVFFNLEKVNMLIFLWKNASTRCFYFCFNFKELIFAVYLTLRLSFYLFICIPQCLLNVL